MKDLYLARFPDGRERQQWPYIVYIRIKPCWLRYSDYAANPPQIVEFDLAAGLPG
ncbi:MAG: hypothetical protein ABIY40_04530 [Rhodanobacteraceae bacterium]